MCRSNSSGGSGRCGSDRCGSCSRGRHGSERLRGVMAVGSGHRTPDNIQGPR